MQCNLVLQSPPVFFTLHSDPRIDRKRGDQQTSGKETADALEKQGAHLLPQLRVQTLNGDLGDTFRQWYPGMTSEAENLLQVA